MLMLDMFPTGEQRTSRGQVRYYFCLVGFGNNQIGSKVFNWCFADKGKTGHCVGTDLTVSRHFDVLSGALSMQCVLEK